MHQLPSYPDEAQREAIVNSFKNLKESSGWLECIRILDLNINFLLEKIVRGEYSGDTELNDIRRDIICYRSLKDLPNEIIEKVVPVNSVSDNLDPYDTLESMENSKNKN